MLEALASALGSADGESAEYFTELLEISLGESPAREIWRKLMAVGTFFPGRGTIVEESYLKGREEGREEGRADGHRQALLRLLEHRGVPSPTPCVTGSPSAQTWTSWTTGWTVP